MKTVYCLLSAAALLASSLALAEDCTDSDLRCGTHLVEIGAAMTEVLNWCGEPTSKEGDQWIYTRSDTQPTIVVYFGADAVVGRISSLPMD